MTPPKFTRWLAPLAVAACLRLVSLERRPMHADEAVLADLTGTLFEQGRWNFQAHDFHGPVLPAAGAAVERAAGARSYAQFSERALRFAPTVAGAALAAVAGGWGGVLIAVSPAMVYWSRYYIPEMFLALWSALFLAALARGRWLAAGLCAGLMFATKETAVLAWLAAAAGWIAARRDRPSVRQFLQMCAAAAVVSLALLTSGFRHWDQLPSLPAALLSRAGGGGHDHPFGWHFFVLRWELLLLPAAALGWKRNPFLAAYAVALALLYSLIPYKTPWCSAQFWWPVLALAGNGRRAALGCTLPLAAGAVWTSFIQPVSNPYAYAQTLEEARQIPERIRALLPTGEPVQFFSTLNLWPLPWELRTLPNQQWRRAVDFGAAPAPLVVLTPEMEDRAAEWLYERRPPGERELYLRVFAQPVCLRDGVEVRLYARGSLLRGP
jgi:hypothetical protein